MTMDELASKTIPPLVVLIIAGLSALFMQVNTLENKALDLEQDFEVYKKERLRIEQKQWEFTMNSNKGVIQLQERCLTKDQYYAERMRCLSQ